MKVGDLVRNLNSESKMTGVVVDWKVTNWEDDFGCSKHPVVLWADGRQNWIMAHRVELANESR
ncbi:MAG: hypothetical protein CL885_04510 [Dehalococcoidia bacterium]|nr:hypothetical protein [Dehalococcoidia bacterium]|tara:strand:- start:57 stop:245 length:189 start_codon:yes stop_codon:yes gene_type:complete